MKERTKELSDWVNQGVLQTNMYQLKLLVDTQSADLEKSNGYALSITSN